MKARKRINLNEPKPNSKEALKKFYDSLSDKQKDLVEKSIAWTRNSGLGLKMGEDYEIERADILAWDKMVGALYKWQRDIYNAMLNTVRNEAIKSKELMEKAERMVENGANADGDTDTNDAKEDELDG